MPDPKWRGKAGPALIGLAALLWATDALVRFPLAGKVDPVRIVFFEHSLILAALLLFGMLCGLPIPALRPLRWKAQWPSRWKDILLAALIGAGGSALATVLFTLSFSHANPTVAILLQKTQPVFVVLIAQAVLKERPALKFYGWAAVALLAATWLSIAPGSALPGQQDLASRGALEALLAAFIWAAATVGGKVLLTRASTASVTLWRFAFGWLALGGYLWVVAGMAGGLARSPSTAHGLVSLFLVNRFELLYMAIIPGLVAMTAYYAGLSRTTASLATFVELLYPVCAICVNAWLLRVTMTFEQGVAATLLVGSVFCLSR